MDNLFNITTTVDKNTFKNEDIQEPLRFKGVDFYAVINSEGNHAEIITHVKAGHRGDFIPVKKRINFELCDLVEVNGSNSAIYKGEKNYYWDLKLREEIKVEDHPELHKDAVPLINEFNKMVNLKLWSWTKKSSSYHNEYWDFKDDFIQKHRNVFDYDSRELWFFGDHTGEPRYSYGFKFNHDKFLAKFNIKLQDNHVKKQKLEERKRRRELEKARISDMVECPVCHGYAEWEKIHGEKVVYDHGFTIGYGHRNNPCYGSRYNCWEKSPKGKQDYLTKILLQRFRFINKNQPTVERLNQINDQVVKADAIIKAIKEDKSLTPADRAYKLRLSHWDYPSFIGMSIQVKISHDQLIQLWNGAKNNNKQEIDQTIKMLREWQPQLTLNEKKAEMKETVEEVSTKPKKHQFTLQEKRMMFGR